MIESIEYIGSSLAFFGAFLLAKNDIKLSKWGFVAYLVSNVFFITWAVMLEVWGILFMNIGFLFINMFGIKKWFT